MGPLRCTDSEGVCMCACGVHCHYQHQCVCVRDCERGALCLLLRPQVGGRRGHTPVRVGGLIGEQEEHSSIHRARTCECG